MNPIGCIKFMNPIVKSLLEFNEAFEIPKLDAPGLGPDEMIELRIKLLTEEVQEYAEALEQAILSKSSMPWRTSATFSQEPSSIMVCKTSTMMPSTKYIEATWPNLLMEKSYAERTVKC